MEVDGTRSVEENGLPRGQVPLQCQFQAVCMQYFGPAKLSSGSPLLHVKATAAALSAVRDSKSQGKASLSGENSSDLHRNHPALLHGLAESRAVAGTL